MKHVKIKFYFLMLVLFLFTFANFIYAEEQPELLNHQFFGEVTWAKDSPVPSKLTAKLGDKIFTVDVRSSPCLEDPCKGRYGYDSDNILRVQGESGTIVFIIDGVDVDEHPYQIDTVTKLDFDLRPEDNTSQPNQGSGSGGSTSSGNQTNVTVTPPPVIQQSKPAPKATPKEVPTFKMPPAPQKAVEKEKEGINVFLISGIILIVVAIGVVAFLIIKKRREMDDF